MRWTSPKYGQLRIRKKFAFFPTYIVADNINIWMEGYFEVMRYGSSMWHKEKTFLSREDAEKFIKTGR